LMSILILISPANYLGIEFETHFGNPLTNVESVVRLRCDVISPKTSTTQDLDMTKPSLDVPVDVVIL
jgi:hypothetical protein